MNALLSNEPEVDIEAPETPDEPARRTTKEMIDEIIESNRPALEEEAAKEKAERTAIAIKDKEALAENVAKAIIALQGDPDLDFVRVHYKRYQNLQPTKRYLNEHGYYLDDYPDSQSFRVYKCDEPNNKCNLL